VDFKLTQQREAYINARGKIVLNACPGSGKTSCIVYKLASLENECLEKHGPYAGIACLSFTNVAKQEIQVKYKKAYGRDFHYPHLVSTIDSFINHYITLPFYNLLNKEFKRPKIIDQASVIDNIFKIWYEHKGKMCEGIISPLNKHRTKDGRPLYRSYPPSSIWIDATKKFTFRGTSPDVENVDETTFQKYGKSVFQVKCKKGLISSGDSAFMALHLLDTHERIGQHLAMRFPYLIVDEAQDNSEIQHLIFDKLVDAGLENIELIGDPYQSLYEWRDAKPELFNEKYVNAAWTGLSLSQNRRSVQRIIDCFSIVRDPADEALTTMEVEDIGIPIHIYRYTEGHLDQIVLDFEEKCKRYKFSVNQIVVRGHSLRDRMLGNKSDVDPWKNYHPSALLAVLHNFESNETKEAVDSLRKLILDLQNPEIDYSSLHDLQKNLKEDHIFNGKLYSFLYRIPAPTLSFEDWSIAAISIIKAQFEIDATEQFEFKRKMTGFKMADFKKEKVNVYFNRSGNRKSNTPITTIHQVKGSTLNAVLYFLDSGSEGTSVSFKDFKSSAGFTKEKQRLIYVACSRAEQFLALALPANITDEELINKFGKGVHIVNL
jgi:DNA helicase-2/ATP-dependent DNA helicase PcrA